MGGVVATMIDEAIEALASGDMSLVDTVREREKEVNRYEVEIDERISYILARHQPTAIDLRMLLAVSKMLTDMERSGDEARKIAGLTQRFYQGDLRLALLGRYLQQPRLGVIFWQRNTSS